jgi:hypothetical protein
MRLLSQIVCDKIPHILCLGFFSVVLVCACSRINFAIYSPVMISQSISASGMTWYKYSSWRSRDMSITRCILSEIIGHRVRNVYNNFCVSRLLSNKKKAFMGLCKPVEPIILGVGWSLIDLIISQHT